MISQKNGQERCSVNLSGQGNSHGISAGLCETAHYRISYLWQKKRGCLSVSFLMPALLVGITYLDELIFAGADLSQQMLLGVAVPALLAGLSGTTLYVCIKIFRPCAHVTAALSPANKGD